MRVLHMLPGLNWGGMEARAVEQVAWFNANGHHAWLTAPAGGEPARRAEAAGVPLILLDVDRPTSGATRKVLREIVAEHGIQVIDAHGTRDAKAAATVMDRCAVVRDRHVSHPLKTSFFRRLQWRWLNDRVVAASESIRRHLIDQGLTTEARSCVVGEWADDAYFDTRADDALPARVRRDLALPANAFVVGNVAMLRIDKGHEHLIRAIALLRERAVVAHLVIVGGATDETESHAAALRGLVDELRLASQVHFTGFRTDVPALTAAFDLLAVSSIGGEAQTRVIPQAFACGRAALGTAIGGIPELVRPGETGWLVPPGDPKALADAIEQAMADRAATRAMGQTAAAFADEHLRMDVKMVETLAAYDDALATARDRWLPRRLKA